MTAKTTDILTKLKNGERSDLIVLAIPSHDRDQRELGISTRDLWTEQAMELFGELYGGATAFKNLKGVYRSDKNRLLWDEPVLVESYSARDRTENPTLLGKLERFARRMREQLRQEAVLLVVNDCMHLIR